MKKLLSVILCLTMMFSLSATTFAAEQTEVVQTTYTNEYDYILAIQELNREELAEIGMTPNDVADTVEAFYKAVDERISLPEETLIGYGYTPEKIELMKSYNTSTFTSRDTSLSDAQLRGIAGVCTGTLSSSYCSSRLVNFTYSWSWDHAPFVKLSDSAAVRWAAYDSNGHEIDVTKYSQRTDINYYWGTTYKFDRDGTQEANLDFNAINLQFDITEIFTSNIGIREEAYAKDGSIFAALKVEPEVTNNISYVKVAALYGHTLIGIGSPSISLSVPAGISIGFSGNASTDPIAGDKVKISIGDNSTSPKVTPILN